ncbi:hypothetical protein N7445_002993 [Penicillium cf. griseofulvum]|nr:hypothetical protein N7445_002993 [Penicillium cf. griseofulvum]
MKRQRTGIGVGGTEVDFQASRVSPQWSAGIRIVSSRNSSVLCFNQKFPTPTRYFTPNRTADTFLRGELKPEQRVTPSRARASPSLNALHMNPNWSSLAFKPAIGADN